MQLILNFDTINVLHCQSVLAGPDCIAAIAGFINVICTTMREWGNLTGVCTVCSLVVPGFKLVT